MIYVNFILTLAVLLAIFNVHLGVVVAIQYQNALYGLLNWIMACILLITAVQKMCELHMQP